MCVCMRVYVCVCECVYVCVSVCVFYVSENLSLLCWCVRVCVLCPVLSSTQFFLFPTQVLFISHRWLHATAGHPDDNNNSKHQHICQAVQSWCKETNTSEHDVHLWVDFACVDQDSVQSMHRSIQSLPFFILLCDAFICIFHDEYESRAWCRLEMLFGFSLRVKLSSFKCYQWRQHKLNAFGFEHDPVTNLPDPAQGRVHSQIDLEYIKALTWFAWKLHTWV